MGKGDKKTAKGKRVIGSYGNSRKRKSTKPVIVVKAKKEKKSEVTATEKKPTAKAATKKATAKKTAKKEA